MQEKERQETSFLKVDRHDMEKGFDPLELLIISEVKGWNRKGKSCFVSNNGFCKMFNINSRSTIIKRIEQLVEKGHLIREYKVINGNKVRYLSIPPSTKIVLPSTDIELPSIKNDIGVVQNLHSPSTKNEPYKNINKNNYKNINKSINKNPKTEPEPMNDKLPDSESIVLTPEREKKLKELEELLENSKYPRDEDFC